MGINAVLGCHRHRVYTYMYRGEESLDIQRWMRYDHAGCFERGCVSIYRDCDEWPQNYSEAYPFETRPAANVRALGNDPTPEAA